jgi:hypothetical protein
MSRFILEALAIAMRDSIVRLNEPDSIFDCRVRSHPHFVAKSSCERFSDARSRATCLPNVARASFNWRSDTLGIINLSLDDREFWKILERAITLVSFSKVIVCQNSYPRNVDYSRELYNDHRTQFVQKN